VLLIAASIPAILASSAAAGPAGCAGKPGSPDRSALLQYCPKKSGSNSADGTSGAATASQTPSTPATGSGQGKHTADAKSGKSQLPLTDYPSSGGINLMLLLLILLAAGFGIAYGARRWRRGRAQAS
jgi:hypothetical protein